MFRYASAAAPALDGVSFEVEPGEIFGFLGPNGAGKTTLMKLLSTVFLPRSGTLEVLGHVLPGGEDAVRKRLGVAFAEYERAFSFRLTGRQNLAFFSALYGIPRRETPARVEEVLTLMGLADKGDALFVTYSTGMKHRLALARALLPRPELLVLDEPTAGLDAQTTRELGATLRGLAKKGTTILYTTHRLEEAASLCDRVLILKDGKVAAIAAPHDLARLANDVIVVSLDVRGVLPDDWDEVLKLAGVVTATLEGRSRMRVQSNDANATTRALLAWTQKRGLVIGGMTTSGASLADAFQAITEGRIQGGTPA